MIYSAARIGREIPRAAYRYSYGPLQYSVHSTRAVSIASVGGLPRYVASCLGILGVVGRGTTLMPRPSRILPMIINFL